MDLLQREGKYPLPPQASKTIMGVEFAGVVSKIGEGAERWKVGDEVFGLAFGVSIPLLGSRRLCDSVVAHHGDLDRTTVTASEVILVSALTAGSICRVHRQPREHAAPQAEGGGMGRGGRDPRELDDGWVDQYRRV